MSDPPRQVSVIGGSLGDPALLEMAEAVGRGLAEAGIRVVCGGLGGVMEAVAKGASGAGGEVIGIVPGSSREDANEYCTHVVATGIGYARNLAVVASGDVVLAIGGEWGTLSEIAFARNVGRQVVTLDSWRVSGRGAMGEGPGIESADTPEQAVARVLELLASA
jgi:uncharacterized protein (TIGR00725 family)